MTRQEYILISNQLSVLQKAEHANICNYKDRLQKSPKYLSLWAEVLTVKLNFWQASPACEGANSNSSAFKTFTKDNNYKAT